MSKADERRLQADQARKAANSAEKKERLVRNVGAAVVVAIVGVIIGIGVYSSGTDEVIEVTGTVPSKVDQTNGAWIMNPDTAATSVLETYEDFQCPGCGAFEGIFGEGIKQLIEEDVVKVVYRPAVFLDNNFPGMHSSRALNALGCAIDQDAGIEFKSLVFAAQPSEEGDGWTDGQLINLGTAAGIADETTFKSCVENGDHLLWASVASEAFSASGVSSTPTIRLDGVDIPSEVISSADVATFVAWVKDNI